MKVKFLLAAGLWLAAASAWAQQVTTTADTGTGSLRTVLAGAAANATVTFSSSINNQVITLTSGEILLNNNVTIDASALTGGVQINGHHNSRIFEVASTATVTLNCLGITNGYASAGGGILNAGTLTLNRCTVAGNAVTSGGGGGGVYNTGFVTFNECTITSNNATSGGGAGGAIIDGFGDGVVTLNQCTVTKNAAATGGAYQDVNGVNTDLVIFNSIVAGNSSGSGPDIATITPVELGNNLTSGAPLLAPLGNYGGLTATMPPLAGSPAIDAGSDTATNAPYNFTTDQRGLPRLAGMHVDIGSVESQPLVVTNTADSGPGSLRNAVAIAAPGTTINFATNLSGQTITFTNGEIAVNEGLSIDASALLGGITFSGNNASRVFNLGAAASVFLNCLTITRCTTSDAGGAIYSSPGSSLQIERCTFTENSAMEGGAILNDGTLLMENSTLAGNAANYGGALQCRYLTTLNQCTLASNSATYGGGGVFNKSSTLTLNNTIIAGNSPAVAGSDLYNQLAAIVYTNANLVQSIAYDSVVSTNGPTPLTNAPLLAALGGHGGPTATMPPLAGSPAVDAGGPTALAIDQRGYPRWIGPAPDLGAVEFRLGSTMVTTNADNGNGSLRYAVDHTLPGSTITFAANLSGGTIHLTGAELLVQWNLTVDASGLANGVIIDGSQKSRIFEVTSNVTVSLNSLALDDGAAAGADGQNGANGDAETVGDNGSDGSPGLGGGIYNAGNLTLNQVAVSNCVAAGGGGGVGGLGLDGGLGGLGGNAQGGGIYNAGSLALNQVIVSGDSASGGAGGYGGQAGYDNVNGIYGGSGGGGGNGQGGGVYNVGSLAVQQITVTGCDAAGGAGGPGGAAVASLTYFTNNTVGGDGGPGGVAQGGGIYTMTSLMLSQSTLAGNSATGNFGGGAGGADNNNDSATAGNPAVGSAGQGGAIYTLNLLTLSECTFTGNSAAGGRGGGGSITNSPAGTGYSADANGGAGQGGAVYNDNGVAAVNIQQVTLAGNAVAGGPPGTNQFEVGDPSANAVVGAGQGAGVYSPATIFIYNSIVTDTNFINAPFGVNTIGNNFTNGNALLAPLGNYGGPTPTRPPLPGSPVIDAGVDSTGQFPTDQRGFPRKSGAAVDLGAVEFQVAGQPFPLTSLTWLNSRAWLGFTNLPGGNFTVLASTNLTLPFNTWSNLGPAMETPPGSGQFQFSDPHATNYTRRFYRVHSP